ncbi:MAG: hypothetical protein WCC27_18805, partial [Acidobacteriaceae bacterium]
WTVTCGGSSCGSFGPATTSNEQLTTYMAPTAIPPGGNVTVAVTSVTDPTKSASTSIAITAAAATLANGTYVFQIAGQPGSNASFYTGVLVASNGAITGGEQDTAYYTDDGFDDGSNLYTAQQAITGGTYATTPDGNMEVRIQVGGAELETINGTLRTGAQGFVAGLDGMPATGTLDLQTSTAAPAGGYALSLFGGDQYNDPAWIGGVVNIDSAGGISGKGSELDVLDGEAGLSGEDAVGASTVSAPDPYGRVTIKLYPGTGSSTLQPVYLAGYVVDATHMRLIETEDAVDDANFQGVLGGTALGQGTNTGKFTMASVAGTSYVFGAQGSDEHGPLDIAGVLTLGANGTVTGTLSWNDVSGGGAQDPVSGQWTVDATGKMTVSNLTSGSSPVYSMRVYLTGDGNGLLLSDDSDDIFAGQVFEQQATPFTAASFSGTYGLNGMEYVPSGLYGELGVEGPLTLSASGGSDAVAGFVDNANGAADFAVSGSFAASATGVFTGSLAGFAPGAGTTGDGFTLYVVDGTQAVVIETGNQQLVLGRLEKVQ